MIKIKEAVIVEGKYDKIKLSSVLDALIIETHGFGIFRDREQMDFIRRMAQTRGLLVLTDSDSAGFLIRNHLAGSISPEKIKHAYIPDLFGKERRKDHPSKEGKLGVEGVPVPVLLDAIQKAGATVEGGEAGPAPDSKAKEITKLDLYETGLSGGPESAEKRRAFLKRHSLPEHLSANALVRVLNGCMSYEDFVSAVRRSAESHDGQDRL